MGFEDGQIGFVRLSHPTQDVDDLAWQTTKRLSEISLLRWLAEKSNLQVPRVIAYGEAPSLAVITKLPGHMLMNRYANLPAPLKVCVSSNTSRSPD